MQALGHLKGEPRYVAGVPTGAQVCKLYVVGIVVPQVGRGESVDVVLVGYDTVTDVLHECVTVLPEWTDGNIHLILVDVGVGGHLRAHLPLVVRHLILGQAGRRVAYLETNVVLRAQLCCGQLVAIALKDIVGLGYSVFLEIGVGARIVPKEAPVAGHRNVTLDVHIAKYDYVHKAWLLEQLRFGVVLAGDP